MDINEFPKVVNRAEKITRQMFDMHLPVALLLLQTSSHFVCAQSLGWIYTYKIKRQPLSQTYEQSFVL